jgi:hypothetical protein
MKRDKEKMGGRWIDLYEASKGEMYAALGRSGTAGEWVRCAHGRGTQWGTQLSVPLGTLYTHMCCEGLARCSGGVGAQRGHVMMSGHRAASHGGC